MHQYSNEEHLSNWLDLMSQALVHATSDLIGSDAPPEQREARMYIMSYTVSCFLAQNTRDGKNGVGVPGDIILGELIYGSAMDNAYWRTRLEEMVNNLDGWDPQEEAAEPDEMGVHMYRLRELFPSLYAAVDSGWIPWVHGDPFLYDKFEILVDVPSHGGNPTRTRPWTPGDHDCDQENGAAVTIAYRPVATSKRENWVFDKVKRRYVKEQP